MSDDLTLYVLTLNCARLTQPPSLLTTAILPTLPSTPPSLLLLSLQEIAPLAPSFVGGTYITPYIASISSAISAATKSVYTLPFELLGFHHIGFTALIAFAHPLAASDISGIQWAGVGLGVHSTGNKGAVALRLRPGRSSPAITAVAVHFAPDEFRAARRDLDWEHTVRDLAFDDGTGLYHGVGPVLVFGDLNYRTAAERPPLGSLFDPATDAAEWWKRDQLTARMRNGLTMHGFEEAPVEFPPTYKYGLATQELEVRRWPSWTDRVVTLKGRGTQVTRYDAVTEYEGSDHKPVFAWVTVKAMREAGEVVGPPWGVREGWRERREAARWKEVVVGYVLIAVENAGARGVIMALVLAALGGWWVFKGFGSAY